MNTLTHEDRVYEEEYTVIQYVEYVVYEHEDGMDFLYEEGGDE